jgi:transcriptional regulator with XRE-family HTH domain
VSSSASHFGNYLRILREGRRLTLDDVERLTLDDPEPVSRSLLSRLETGKTKLTTRKLLSLARVYGLRLGSLAERFEGVHETLCLERERLDKWPAVRLLAAAADAAKAGNIRRALFLYQRAATKDEADAPHDDALVRAKLEAARTLMVAGRLRLARDLLEGLLSHHLADEHRLLALYRLGQVALELDLPFVARAVSSALDEARRPWPAPGAFLLPALRAELHVQEGCPSAALEAWRGALAAAHHLEHAPGQAVAALGLAAVERRRGRAEPARAWVEQARRLCQSHELTETEVHVLLESGRVHLLVHRSDLARREWRIARRAAREQELGLDRFRVFLEVWRIARLEHDRLEERGALHSLEFLLRSVDMPMRDTADLRHYLAAEADKSAPQSAGAAD